MTGLDLLAHDLAVVDALAGLGRPVGLGEAPEGALVALRSGAGPDYLVVHPLPLGSRTGPAGDPDADAELVWQVTCVARRPEGARWLAGRVESALGELAVPGRAVMRVVPDNAGGLARDDSLGDPPLFYATPRVRVFTTPA